MATEETDRQTDKVHTTNKHAHGHNIHIIVVILIIILIIFNTIIIIIITQDVKSLTNEHSETMITM